MQKNDDKHHFFTHPLLIFLRGCLLPTLPKKRGGTNIVAIGQKIEECEQILQSENEQIVRKTLTSLSQEIITLCVRSTLKDLLMEIASKASEVHYLSEHDPWQKYAVIEYVETMKKELESIENPSKIEEIDLPDGARGQFRVLHYKTKNGKSQTRYQKWDRGMWKFITKKEYERSHKKFEEEFDDVDAPKTRKKDQPPGTPIVDEREGGSDFIIKPLDLDERTKAQLDQHEEQMDEYYDKGRRRRRRHKHHKRWHHHKRHHHHRHEGDHSAADTNAGFLFSGLLWSDPEKRRYCFKQIVKTYWGQWHLQIMKLMNLTQQAFLVNQLLYGGKNKFLIWKLHEINVLRQATPFSNGPSTFEFWVGTENGPYLDLIWPGLTDYPGDQTRKVQSLLPSAEFLNPKVDDSHNAVLHGTTVTEAVFNELRTKTKYGRLKDIMAYYKTKGWGTPTGLQYPIFEHDTAHFGCDKDEQWILAQYPNLADTQTSYFCTRQAMSGGTIAAIDEWPTSEAQLKGKQGTGTDTMANSPDLPWLTIVPTDRWLGTNIDRSKPFHIWNGKEYGFAYAFNDVFATKVRAGSSGTLYSSQAEENWEVYSNVSLAEVVDDEIFKLMAEMWYRNFARHYFPLPVNPALKGLLGDAYKRWNGLDVFALNKMLDDPKFDLNKTLLACGYMRDPRDYLSCTSKEANDLGLMLFYDPGM